MRGLALLLVGMGACQAPPPRAAAVRLLPAFPCYEVSIADDGATVHVEATYPASLGRMLRADPATTPYFHEVEVEREGAWSPVARVGTTWSACPGACRVRYRFALGDAARALDDHDYAQRFGALILAPPGSFLLRPSRYATGTPFRFHVATGSTRFLTGVLPTASADTYQADLADLADLPYTAIGTFRAQSVHLVDATLQVALAGHVPDVGDARLIAWIETCAGSIRRYFGRFALAHAAIIVVIGEGDAIDGAMTMGNGGGSVLVHVGRRTPEPALETDWQMTHEMVHLSMPNMPESQRWLEEGLATYVEPLARARAGLVSEQQVWTEMARGMPHGLPLADEGGLDHTPTWGRTYWGGALFALLADVRIREQTHNASSLDDALKAVQAAGGNASTRWSMQRMIQVGDRATGTTVLRDLYAAMGQTPMHVDLAALWGRLGIRTRAQDAVRFDDMAPLAAIRASMTAAQSN